MLHYFKKYVFSLFNDPTKKNYLLQLMDDRIYLNTNYGFS